jgi:glutaredoxin 3
MARITVYTTESCPFCMRAKALLDQKGADYDEVFISRSDHGARERLVAETGGYTFPQVIIDDTVVGGWDQLSALDQRGELDPLLA